MSSDDEQKHPRLICPYCYSTNTVLVWEGDTVDGPPDYVGGYDCNSDMIDLREVEERLREFVEETGEQATHGTDADQSNLCKICGADSRRPR